MDPTQAGKCTTCGLLAHDDQYGRRLEIRATDREAEAFTRVKALEPVCMRKLELGFEREQAWLNRDKGPAREAARSIALQVLQRQRRCPYWEQHYPGLAPDRALEQSLMKEWKAQIESDRRRSREADTFRTTMLSIVGLGIAALQVLTAWPGLGMRVFATLVLVILIGVTIVLLIVGAQEAASDSES